MSNEVHVTLLQDTRAGKYVWAVIHVGHDDAPDIDGMNYESHDAAKSAAWNYAQVTGATYKKESRP